MTFAQFWSEWGTLVSTIIGAVCAYFGSLNAIREDMATLKERTERALENANEAKEFAHRANSRVDSMLMK